MVTLAHALVPPDIGRVLMHTVVVPPEDWRPDENPRPFERAQAVLRELLTAAVKVGARAETMITVASKPVVEIARVARIHNCQSVLVGLSEISEEDRGTRVERLLGTADADIVVLRSRPNWQLAEVKNILVPVAGRGGHDRLIARLLGSLLRTGQREVTLLRVLPARASRQECRRAQREVSKLAEDEVSGAATAVVQQSDDPVSTIAEHAERCDLLIMGVQRLDRRRKLFGNVIRQIAARTTTPMLVVSRRG
jgi:nucleotide-binding universal stress UspA family protein